MSTFTLVNLDNVKRQLGRAVVFYAPYWTGVADIALTHLGDTEGNVVVNPNSAYSKLIATEVRGPAVLEAYEDGADPTIDLPGIWMADPALRDIISPTASGSIGHTRRRKVTTYTVVLFPEEMFFDDTTKLHKVVAYTTAGGWTVNAIAMTAEQLRLLGLSVWAWRGYFTRPAITYSHADAGKDLESATFQVMVDTTKPEGEQLVTLGNPLLTTPPILLDAA